MIPIALTIAGSDPSGGAGIQADLKAFSALKVYGMAVIAALTAQNTVGVSGAMDVPASFVVEQIDAVVRDLRPASVKTGMLSNATVVQAVARSIRDFGLTQLIVDPVMISTSGTRLLSAEGVTMMRMELLPLALIVTPNLAEAQILTGRVVRTEADMEEAALDLHALGARNIYIKGGHLEGEPVDVFFDGQDFLRLAGQRLEVKDIHGTGCILSAALAGYVARGESAVAAARLAKEFVSLAIRRGLRLGSGRGPCDPLGLSA